MSKLGLGVQPTFDNVRGQRSRVIGFPLLIFFPRAETVFTPAARIPSLPAEARQIRGKLKFFLLCKPHLPDRICFYTEFYGVLGKSA